MRRRRDRTHSCFLLESANDLEQKPKNENEPGWQSNPVEPDESPAHQKSEPHPWKIQRIKRNDASDAAARTDARSVGARIKCDVRQVTNERCHCDEHEISQRP